MTKLVGEFKKFINRGNVVDLAVGVMVGSSFTAMVNGLSNFILKPLVNFLIARLIGSDTTANMHTYLTYVYDEEGKLDLTQSIYIDWGSFISAVINFLLIAFVLFTIVKIVNKIRAEHKEFQAMIAENTLSRSEIKELKKAGVKIKDKAAVKAYFDEKKRLADEEKARAEEQAAKKAALEREQNPTTEDLLKLILCELRK